MDPKIFDALIFATRAHQNQRRKFNNDPYIVHPMRVAKSTQFYLGNDSLVIPALLHDVIEDTEIKENQIAELFGQEVLRIVLDVTNDEDQIKLKGKALFQFEKIKKLLQENRIDSIILKLCDRLDNLKDSKELPTKNYEATEIICSYLLSNCHNKIVQEICKDIKLILFF